MKKIFPQLCNTFCIFILNMHILFCCKNQKSVLQIKIKDCIFEVYLLTEEPNSWFPLIESWKMTCARSYVWFLNFLSNGVGLDCFLQPVLPKLSKITVTCPKWGKENKQGQFWLVQSQPNEYQFWTDQSQQHDQFENLFIFSHVEARNIKFGQQVNFI